jgi:hypothetical protein
MNTPLGILTLGFPAGLWALLAVPCLLAIHLLQQQRRRQIVTTLFLIPKQPPDSRVGAQLDRLRNSRSLWLQLAAILLAVWLLVAPQFLQEHSVRRILLIVDTTPSMEAVRKKLLSSLPELLEPLTKTTARIDWNIVSGSAAGVSLYTGRDLTEGLARLRTEPFDAIAFNPSRVIDLLRPVTAEGAIICTISDRVLTPPPTDCAIGIGSSIPNVGVVTTSRNSSSGEEMAQTVTALVKNFGVEATTRSWELRREPRDPSEAPSILLSGTINLSADAIESVEIPLPRDTDGLVFALNPDNFLIDDATPLLREEKRLLPVLMELPTHQQKIMRRLVASWGDTDLGGSGQRGLQIEGHEQPSHRSLPKTSSIQLVVTPEGTTRTNRGVIVPEVGGLASDLSWQGLLAAQTRLLPQFPTERPLLWQGGDPLISIVREGESLHLLIHFDLARSNAARHPAFVVLLARFGELVRGNTPGSFKAIYPAGSAIRLFQDPKTDSPQFQPVRLLQGIPYRPISPTPDGSTQLPQLPGYLSSSGESSVLVGTSFQNLRESDFRAARDFVELPQSLSTTQEQFSDPDPFTPFLLLLLPALLIALWPAATKRVPVMGGGRGV